MWAIGGAGIFLLLSLLDVSHGQQNDPPREWYRGDYPNPQTDLYRCGRRGRPSYICDPNNIITLQQADDLERTIMDVRNQTSCPCPGFVCDQRRGYGIWVALVQRVRPNPVRESNRGEDNRLVDTTLKHARLFAYTQEEFWELTDCDVVLLYSLEDNVVYTTTGVEAEKRLDNDKVADISMKARHNFGHDKDIYHGLDSIVRDYKDAFLGR